MQGWYERRQHILEPLDEIVKNAEIFANMVLAWTSIKPGGKGGQWCARAKPKDNQQISTDAQRTSWQ